MSLPFRLTMSGRPVLIMLEKAPLQNLEQEAYRVPQQQSSHLTIPGFSGVEFGAIKPGYFFPADKLHIFFFQQFPEFLAGQVVQFLLPP